MFEMLEVDLGIVFMQQVYYDGHLWSQSLTWDGYHQTIIEHSATPQSETEGNRVEMTATAIYAHPDGDFVFEQELDLRGEAYENS